MSVYLVLELIAIIIPLLYSYDRKLRFYLKFRSVIFSLLIVGAFYIVADVLFTRYGVWGFNPAYHSNINLAGLPIEEWLFFLVIPYASLFLHETLIYLYPGIRLNPVQTKVVSLFLVTVMAIVIVLNHDKIYTSVCLSVAIFSIFLSLYDSSQILNRFYFTFIIILVPFFLVDSVLTGSFIPDEIVWYNNSEIIGIRIFTVPIEDIFYAFGLILFNLLLISRLEKYFKKKTVNR